MNLADSNCWISLICSHVGLSSIRICKHFFNTGMLFIYPYHYIPGILYLQNGYISIAFYYLLGSIEAPRNVGLFGCRNVGSPMSKTTWPSLKLPQIILCWQSAYTLRCPNLLGKIMLRLCQLPYLTRVYVDFDQSDCRTHAGLGAEQPNIEDGNRSTKNITQPMCMAFTPMPQEGLILLFPNLRCEESNDVAIPDY